MVRARALLAVTLRPPLRACLVALATLALAGCQRGYAFDVLVHDGAWDVPVDPRVPNVGEGRNAPACAAGEVIDVTGVGFREGLQLRVRLDTRNRRNDLHPACVDRDASEAVLRYTAPEGVVAVRVSTEAAATEYDTVISVRGECSGEVRDDSCNNDGILDDGRESRRSTVYYAGLRAGEPLYILVDGFNGSVGQAEVVITEFAALGELGAPCLPVPGGRTNDPRAATDSTRCPAAGLRCRPNAAVDGTDLCLTELPVGAACDPVERRNVCEPFPDRGVLCAQNPRSRTEAFCALPGTAPGAVCRASEPRCDARMTCSPGSGFENRDICVPLRTMGAACDPATTGFVDRCEPGLSCCGDIADAGASFTCRPAGYQPCFAPAATGP